MTALPRSVLVALGVTLAALAALPFVAGEFYLLLFTKIMALAIFAMSLDLLLGYTGMVSFGHAAYFGIAAYTAAMLAPQYEAANLLVTLPAAISAAALAALVIGALCVRTSGIYFIMVTLAFAQMAFFVFHDIRHFGGSDGKLLFAKPDIMIGETVLVSLGSKVPYYYFTLAMMVAAYVLLAVIVRSPFGRVIQGIKVNEARMRALGYNTYRYKLVSFVIGGALAGLAGYLVAYQGEFVNPEMLNWRESGLVLMMVILGGSGTLYGPALGALLLVLLQEVLREVFPLLKFVPGIADRWMLGMGLFVVLIVIFLPRGLSGLLLKLGAVGLRPPKGRDDG
jgi:branched-chain amino acid transport system permease protein